MYDLMTALIASKILVPMFTDQGVATLLNRLRLAHIFNV